MRIRYRRRRDALVEALAEALPEAVVEGIAGGLHAAVRLAETDVEQAIYEEAQSRRIALATIRDYRVGGDGPPTLLLGYAQSPEPTIRAGVAELASAVRATRARGGP